MQLVNNTSNQTKLDTYLSLCAEYYDLDKPKAQKELLEFYQSYAVEAGGAILEPMCGTGNFLIPFTEKGLKIEGYDASDEMLSILGKKSQEKSLRVSAWKQFTQKPVKPNQYSLIFLPLGSIGLIIEDSHIETTLQNFFEALNPGGKLVFEASTPKDYQESNTWTGGVRYRNKNDFITLSTLSLPLKNSVGTTICRYELIESGQVTKQEIEPFKLRLHEPKSLKDLLERVGFQDIKLLKPYRRDIEACQDDELVIYECLKTV